MKHVYFAAAASLLLHSFFASLTSATAQEHRYRYRLSEQARTTQRITEPQQLAIAAYQLKSFITAPPPNVSGSGRRGIVISAGGEHLLSNAYVTAKVGTIIISSCSIRPFLYTFLHITYIPCILHLKVSTLLCSLGCQASLSQQAAHFHRLLWSRRTSHQLSRKAKGG